MSFSTWGRRAWPDCGSAWAFPKPVAIRPTMFSTGFTSRNMAAIDVAILTAADAVETWIAQGIGQAMNRFNIGCKNRRRTVINWTGKLFDLTV